jgi:hypothetical protein
MKIKSIEICALSVLLGSVILSVANYLLNHSFINLIGNISIAFALSASAYWAGIIVGQEKQP